MSGQDTNDRDQLSEAEVKEIISRHNARRKLRMEMPFPGVTPEAQVYGPGSMIVFGKNIPGIHTAAEAKARADGQADVGQLVAGLINDLNSFVGNSSVGNDSIMKRGPKKVSGKQGIEEMIEYLRIRIKDMVFDLEATHRELAEVIDNDQFNC